MKKFFVMMVIIFTVITVLSCGPADDLSEKKNELESHFVESFSIGTPVLE